MNHNQEPSIGELVDRLFKTHRKPNGQEYSNQEVGKALDLDPGYIGKLRNNKVPNPGRDTLKQLCIFFGVPASYFFPELEPLTPDEEKGNPYDSLHYALHAFGLDSEFQHYIQGLIERLRKDRPTDKKE